MMPRMRACRFSKVVSPGKVSNRSSPGASAAEKLSMTGSMGRVRVRTPRFLASSSESVTEPSLL